MTDTAAREIATRRGAAVDVIVPVYRGFEETRTCLESVLVSPCRTRFELIVIDDASPEPALAAWLKTLAGRNGVTVLPNPRNLGFVCSVNRGMQQHDDRDVVLLNSDTEVAPGWLDRLRQAACRDARTGSVTPFSNNATICSYPRFVNDNELPRGWSLSQLDALFAHINAGERVELVTAVGFCMYIRRDCLADAGVFDEANFGNGYGEENEFCMRARRRGWRHYLAADCYVRHAGAVSFADTRADRQREALNTLLTLQPSYEARVARFVRHDPVRPYRATADIARLAAPPRPVLLHVGHALGGGTARHVEDLGRLLADQAAILVLAPIPEARGRLRLFWPQPGEALDLRLDPGADCEHLVALLRHIGISRVHFQHVMGLPEAIKALPWTLNIPYDVTVHDFYAYCPQVHLQDANGTYCGEPEVGGCRECLRKRPAPGGLDIERWRREFDAFLAGAERVLAPSLAVGTRLHRHFPALEWRLAPHPEPGAMSDALVRPAPLDPDEPLRVAVLGALNVLKGADVLEATALLAGRQRAPVAFTLIGFAHRELATHPEAALTVTGAYQEEALPQHLDALRPHVVWFPAQVPETFSYTLSACLNAGLPVVVTDLGALPERVAGRPWSWVLDWGTTPGDWLAFFTGARWQLIEQERPPRSPVATGQAPSGPTFDYSIEYIASSQADVRPLESLDGAALRALLRTMDRGRWWVRLLCDLPLGVAVRWRRHPLLAGTFRRLPLAVRTRVRNWVLGAG